MKTEIVLATPVEIVPVAKPLRSDQNPCAIYLGSLLEGLSRESTRRALAMFLRAMDDCDYSINDVVKYPWHTLRAKHFDVARAALMAAHKPASANKAINSARCVMHLARRERLISIEDLEDIVKTKRVRGKSVLAGRAITEDEAAAVLELCAAAKTPLELRDAGVIVLIWGSGCRRHEASTTNLRDYDSKTNTIRILGKNQNVRDVPLSPAVCEFLDRWVAVRGSAPGPLFYSNTRDEKLVVGSRLPGQTIYDRCSKLGFKACGVRDITPHNLRRTAATEQLSLPGADSTIVGRNLGQDDPKTTALYDRRPMERQRDVVNQRKMPTRKK